MKNRFQEPSIDADQKQEERFDLWMSGEGINFKDENAKAVYRERVAVLKDAIQLKKLPNKRLSYTKIYQTTNEKRTCN